MVFNTGIEFNVFASYKHETDQQSSYVTCANKVAETDIRFYRANQHCTNATYSLITAVTIVSNNLDQPAFLENFQPHLEFHFKPGTFPDSDYVRRRGRRRRNTNYPF
jgi:hypothetical protein